MTTLVLNRFDLARTDYAGWAAPGTELVLVTHRAALPGGSAPDGYAHVEVVDDYAGPEVELRAHALHARYGFDRVLAMSEWDLVRAGRLRDAWGLDGQSEAGALLFRDKLRMKEALAAAGVPVARWQGVDDPSALRRAAAALGYPLVVKPRRGAASVGVSVVEDDEALVACAATAQVGVGDRPADLLAEEFVSNDLLHVDGIVHRGEVLFCWPSAQTASCLDITRGTVQLAVHLDESDPRVPAVQDLTVRALRALDVPASSLFHAEVFAVDDGFVVNEVACRIGGSKIRDQVIRAFDVDPVEWHARDALGTAPARLPAARPVRRAGYALVPTRRGTITRLDAPRLPASVVVFDAPHAVGDVLDGPASSLSALASFVCTGRSRRDVVADLEAAVTAFEDAVSVEPAGSPA